MEGGGFWSSRSPTSLRCSARVGVNSGASASLSSTSSAVGHYVNILETFTTKDGVDFVRVYSSLEHREEIYTWEHFQATWGKWENVGDNSAGQAIIARPGGGG
ncbi:MAG: hypothetical protein A2W26_10435 [Acidobacteria bacterium RBG_16_64_8]|nr:MAG: hypothetical protein A2W26_10435 [Acidobacteria bacterium RBG_16_64_8]